MAQIHLSIVTPLGVCFDGQADRVMARTTGGDVAILPGHIDYTASLGNGQAKLTVDGQPKLAEIHGGILSVVNNHVRIITDSFAWKE